MTPAPAATRPSRSRRRIAALLGTVALGVLVSACGNDDDASTAATVLVDGKPVVLVTYSVLGDVVSQLVGDAAVVQVLVPNGQDPHDFSPSARDVESMQGAALIVANGLDLEEGLVEALEQTADAGVAVFAVSDHVTVRELGEGEEHAHEEDGHDEEGHEEEGHDHEHEGGDPHLWTDPLTMREMIPALAAELEEVLGVDLAAAVTAVEAEMDALDAEVRTIMAAIPAGECRLVTGHESLGYFADRYGCELIGAVVPGLSSTAEASAQDLAELSEVAQETGVAAIFTEVGTPAQVAEQVASEVGVPLVELPSHQLPDTGGYQAFVVDLATRIADALAGAA